MTLNSEQLEELFPYLADAFDTITDRLSQPPRALSASEIGERLNVRIDSKKLDAQSLLKLADAVLELNPEHADTPLIQASYFQLVKEHAPWALKE